MKPTRFFLFLWICLSITQVSSAYLRMYWPEPLKGVGPVFALKRLGQFYSIDEWRAQVFADFPGLAFEPGPRDFEMRLKGVRTSGNAEFLLDVSTIASGFTVFAGDLDRNGQIDLLILSQTRGNGWAPQNVLWTLLFSETGEAVVTEHAGWFGLTKDGQIEDLVDLDGDGRAEIFLMNQAADYWKTSLLEAQSTQWHNRVGRFGKFTFPIFTRFAYKSNHKVVVPESEGL